MIASMIIEAIRRQIKTCGKTRYRIAKETGVGEDQLCRIMQGKTCTVETADILLKHFKLKLVAQKARGKAKKTKQAPASKSGRDVRQGPECTSRIHVL